MVLWQRIVLVLFIKPHEISVTVIATIGTLDTLTRSRVSSRLICYRAVVNAVLAQNSNSDSALSHFELLRIKLLFFFSHLVNEIEFSDAVAAGG